MRRGAVTAASRDVGSVHTRLRERVREVAVRLLVRLSVRPVCSLVEPAEEDHQPPEAEKRSFDPRSRKRPVDRPDFSPRREGTERRLLATIRPAYELPTLDPASLLLEPLTLVTIIVAISVIILSRYGRSNQSKISTGDN